MAGEYWRADLPGLSWLITDNQGGASRAPFASFNLGEHVGDDPAAVTENRNRLARALDVKPAAVHWLNQVHGCSVAQFGAGSRGAPQADAQVTNEAGVALAVLVADCTPVLLADRQAGVIGAAHAGRPGMLGGVIPATLTAMRELGASTISALVGPSVCGRCYEVPQEMRDAAEAISPISAAVSWQGTPAIDVAAGVIDQLDRGGVSQITRVPGCTREDSRLFSYRRDGMTGRFAAVAVLR